MAVNGTVLEIIRGEKKTWEYTVAASGGAQSLTGASIYFAARNAIPASSLESDSDAVFTRIVGTGITVTNASAGKFQVTINKSNTACLAIGSGGVDYYYGLEILLSGETEPQVIGQGVLRVLPDIVRAK